MSLGKQGLGFLLVGGLQLLFDWAIFVVATRLGAPVEAGNVLGRVAGAGLGFWLNGRYTFAQDGRSLAGRHALVRFGILWLATTFVSTLAMSSLAHSSGLSWAWLGKPLVEACLALAGFIASRHWIYRP
jgi:putative flippase GtrA